MFLPWKCGSTSCQKRFIKTKFEEVDPFDMKISDYKYIDKYTDEQIKIVNKILPKILNYLNTGL